MKRVTHTRQQGSRIGWGNELFQTVPMANVPSSRPLEPLPVPESREVPFAEFERAMREQADTVPGDL